jgi:hypothetical protein
MATVACCLGKWNTSWVDRSDRDDNEINALVAEQAVKSVTDADTVSHHMNLLEAGLGATSRAEPTVTTPKKVITRVPEEDVEEQEELGENPFLPAETGDDDTQDTPKVAQATRAKARSEQHRGKTEAEDTEAPCKSPKGKADGKAAKRPRVTKAPAVAKKKPRVVDDKDIPSDEG